MTKTKQIYRIIGQDGGVTIAAHTAHDVTKEEAADIAKNELFKAKQIPFVILPLTTEDRWQDGSINFCPRCGENISDFGMDDFGSSDCFHCDASFDVSIRLPEVDTEW